MTDPWAIDTAGLTKRYVEVTALRGLDLQVPAGSICGLLGRNGAGKTTTLKILLGLTHADGGRASVLGLDVAADGVAIRRRTAFVSEDKDLYDTMTVDEMVRFTARFYPRWSPDLEARYRRAFGLPGERPVKALSRGMRTKLALLLAFCRGAELLVLDEPTAGLDPAAAEDVLQALVSHVAIGSGTVLLSSHQVAEIEQIADRVAIVDRGRMVLQGALDDLRDSVRRLQLVFDGAAPEAMFRTPGVVRVRREGRVLTVLATANADALLAEAHTLAPRSIDATPVPLKDLFLDLVAEA